MWCLPPALATHTGQSVFLGKDSSLPPRLALNDTSQPELFSTSACGTPASTAGPWSARVSFQCIAALMAMAQMLQKSSCPQCDP